MRLVSKIRNMFTYILTQRTKDELYYVTYVKKSTVL